MSDVQASHMHDATSRHKDADSYHPTANAELLQDLKTTLGKDATMLEYIPINAIHIYAQPLIPGTLPYRLDLGTITDTSQHTLTLVAFLKSNSHINVKDGGLPHVLFFGYGPGGIITDRVPFTAKRVFQVGKLHEALMHANCDPTMLAAVAKYVFLAKGVVVPGVGGFKSGFTRLLLQARRAYKEEQAAMGGNERTSPLAAKGAKAIVEMSEDSTDEYQPTNEELGGAVSADPETTWIEEDTVQVDDSKDALDLHHGNEDASQSSTPRQSCASNELDEYLTLHNQNRTLKAELLTLDDAVSKQPHEHCVAIARLAAKHDTETKALNAKHAQALDDEMDKQHKETRNLTDLQAKKVRAQEEAQQRLGALQASMPREKMGEMLEQLQQNRAADERPAKRRKVDGE
jgi:hypothetical protein